MDEAKENFKLLAGHGPRPFNADKLTSKPRGQGQGTS